MSTEGYIKLSRKYFDNPLWTEPRVYSRAEAWIDLIQSAKFEAQSLILDGRAIEVQRGEIVASRRYLEIRWKWSNTKVDNFIKLLVDQGMISKRNAKGNTVLTLTNFSTYNDVNATKNATETPHERQQNATRTPNIRKIRKKECKDKEREDGDNVASLTEPEIPDSENYYFGETETPKNPVSDEKEKSCAKKEKTEITVSPQESANFKKFQAWIRDNAPQVAKFKEPFTPEQFVKLKQDFDLTTIQDLLVAMHNYKPLLVKNISANLTFRRWAKQEKMTSYGKSDSHSADTKIVGDPKKRSDSF